MLMQQPVYKTDVQLTYTVEQNIVSSITQILEEMKKTGVFQYLIVKYNSDGTIGYVMRGLSLTGVVTLGLAPAYFGVSVDIQGPLAIVAFAQKQLAQVRAEYDASASQQSTSHRQTLRN